MSPMPDGGPTAAELDRAIKAEFAYDAAIAEGKTEADALEIARARSKEYAEEQFLRSLGVDR